MAYSTNILPRSAAYYTLSNATIENTELVLEAGGFAEIQVSSQMLPKLTENMLVVAHPSVFSSAYTNDAVQITLSIITSSGSHIEYLIPVSYNKSGVFNTEIILPEEEFVVFTYRISSKVPAVIYNWELCAEEAADVTTIIEGVEQELPKLLYDYNTYSYAVAQKELTVGLISCFLHSDTDLQGHFTLSFFATERCNVHVRIKDNGVTELFSPQVFTVERGYASISVPHAYLKKKSTDHAFSVSVQCTNGQLSIPVRGLLYTIDGGYLATRLLDAGIDVQDISIRQVPSDNSPSEIWAIGFESTRLVLKKRVYSQAQRANWTAIKDFGEGLTAGVEFNGQWLSRSNSEAYTLETQETPFVFILDLDKNLKAYHGADFNTMYSIDTGVDSFSACQGFNSMLEANQDQGVILAYIKNGNVYYTQWLYDNNTGAYRWYPAEALYENGDAAFVSVHRLPDYRVGICVTHTAGTKWYITDRTWVGQAVKPEIAKAHTRTFIVTSVLGVDRAEDTIGLSATTNEFEEQEYYNGFTMTFDGPLVFVDGKGLNDLLKTIKVSINGTVLSTDEFNVDITDNVMTVTLNEDIKGGRTVLIEYNSNYLFIKAYNNSLAYIKQSYSWYLIPPMIYYNDSGSVHLNGSLSASVVPITTTQLQYIEDAEVPLSSSLDLTVKEIITTNEEYNEATNINISGELSLTTTLVGTTPV